MEDNAQLRVLYVGNSEYIYSTGYIGCSASGIGHFINGSKNLKKALSSDPGVEVHHIHGHSAMEEFPKSAKELAVYDLVILSDVGADNILFYPEIFSGPKVPFGENRLLLIRDFVANGGGFVMIGGWFSYGGYTGLGKYHHTPIEEILPVWISPYDDRVEVVQGFHLKPNLADHPITKGIPWNEANFWLLGYNRVVAKKEATILAEYDGDPILSVGQFGKGRTVSFTSCCSPHWSGDFPFWPYFSKFWNQLVRWAAKGTVKNNMKERR